MSLAGSLLVAIDGEQWEDLRAPASTLPLRGNSGDPDDDVDGSLLFDAATGEQISIIYQMPHGWQRNAVRFHCHWAKTTSATGHVRWEERHRIWNNNDVTPDWSSWVAATGISVATGADQKTRISSFPEWSMAGMKGSCMISVQLRRNGATGADNYGADAKLWEADLHYRMTGGSETEVPTY